MNRNEVKSKLKLVTNKLAELEEIVPEETFFYKTLNKHLNGVGYISEIDNFKDLAQAHSKITKHISNNLDESYRFLGLTDAEKPKETAKLLGFSISTWLEDIKTKRDQLRLDIQIEKLTEAKEILTRNLSAEDKFDLDTESIDSLLA